MYRFFLLAQVANLFTFHSPPEFGDAFYGAMYSLYLRHQKNMRAHLSPDKEADGLLCDSRMTCSA